MKCLKRTLIVLWEMNFKAQLSENATQIKKMEDSCFNYFLKKTKLSKDNLFKGSILHFGKKEFELVTKLKMGLVPKRKETSSYNKIKDEYFNNEEKITNTMVNEVFTTIEIILKEKCHGLPPLCPYKRFLRSQVHAYNKLHMEFNFEGSILHFGKKEFGLVTDLKMGLVPKRKETSSYNRIKDEYFNNEETITNTMVKEVFTTIEKYMEDDDMAKEQTDIVNPDEEDFKTTEKDDAYNKESIELDTIQTHDEHHEQKHYVDDDNQANSQEREGERDDHHKCDLLDAGYIGHGKRLRNLAKEVRSPYLVNKKMLAKLKTTIPTNTFNPMRPVSIAIGSALEFYMRLESP
ncbi:hypothetical protein FNV43_RR10421 [Rhamnella rubrinervis]|uniref:Uncharacterized protein n=1 Tax=Rhamnella rubrinervis TaxID=2594499 RepID=A0A8K0MLB0_9ROSA|nr:hypothetical protein FNV43_RR10421 [Rhamnella rubrinervis]